MRDNVCIVYVCDVLNVKLNFITINLNRAFDLGAQCTENLIFAINFMRIYSFIIMNVVLKNKKMGMDMESDRKVLHHMFQCLILTCLSYVIMFFYFVQPPVVLIYLCFEVIAIPRITSLAFVLFLSHILHTAIATTTQSPRFFFLF